MTMFASIGPNLPQDLFAATASYVGPVRFDPDRAAPRAGQWLESKFAPWAFPVLESWAEGAYDDLDCVVFSRADDTAHRLYYYICELQRTGAIGGPEPVVFDVAKIARPSSVERLAAQVRLLAGRFKLTPGQIAAAIAATNHERAKPAPALAGKVCLVAGTAMPDRRLLDVVSAAGFVPVGQTLPEDWSRLGGIVEQGSGDPELAIARQLNAENSGPRSMGDPAQRLSDQIAACKAAAIVLWRIEEDEAEAWHMPGQLRAIERAAIPSLVMTRRDWLARDGAAQEIAAFLEGLGA